MEGPQGWLLFQRISRYVHLLTFSCILEPAVFNVPTKVIGSKQAGTQYTERSAVRVVVKGSDGGIVIVKVLKGNYYKLPGGGIEDGEDHHEAAEREVAQETGARVSAQGSCVAMTEEYRNDLTKSRIATVPISLTGRGSQR